MRLAAARFGSLPLNAARCRSIRLAGAHVRPRRVRRRCRRDPAATCGPSGCRAHRSRVVLTRAVCRRCAGRKHRQARRALFAPAANASGLVLGFLHRAQRIEDGSRARPSLFAWDASASWRPRQSGSAFGSGGVRRRGACLPPSAALHRPSRVHQVHGLHTEPSIRARIARFAAHHSLTVHVTHETAIRRRLARRLVHGMQSHGAAAPRNLSSPDAPRRSSRSPPLRRGRWRVGPARAPRPPPGFGSCRPATDGPRPRS